MLILPRLAAEVFSGRVTTADGSPLICPRAKSRMAAEVSLGIGMTTDGSPTTAPRMTSWLIAEVSLGMVIMADVSPLTVPRMTSKYLVVESVSEATQTASVVIEEASLLCDWLASTESGCEYVSTQPEKTLVDHYSCSVQDAALETWWNL